MKKLDKRAFKVKLRTELTKEYIKGENPTEKEIRAFVTGFNMGYKSLRKKVLERK